MSWRDRIRGTIELTSPGGQTFTALWGGNSRSREKKLGIYNYPKVDGAVVQDLGINSTTYPLTIFFDGDDNDIEANRFFNALAERGVWDVVHPLFGALILQPVSFTPIDNPVESGNVTEIGTEWIEPIPTDTILSTVQIAAQIEATKNESNAKGSEQLVAKVELDTAEQTTTFKAAVTDGKTAIERFLGPIAELTSEVDSAFKAISRSIDDTLDQVTIPVDVIAGQLQQMIQVVDSATTDFGAKLTAFRNLSNDVLLLLPTIASSANINNVAVIELIETATIAVTGIATAGAELDTRSEAITAIDTIGDQFTTITDGLDDIQSLYSDRDIDLQYFSQSLSFPDSSRLTFQAIALLLRRSFDLAIEKRFILDRPRAPIEITVTEYGELGDNDTNFDLFIGSNNLTGDEIRILPAGRQVVVYVGGS